MPARAAGRRETSVDLVPIAPLVERIVTHLRPEEIWLFGSRAEGRARLIVTTTCSRCSPTTPPSLRWTC